MNQRRSSTCTTFAILLAALCLHAAAQSVNRHMEPAIRQVDHVLVQTGDPQLLFDFFTDTLQLPIAWPISEQAGFTSCGVGIGNVNIEIFRLAGRRGQSKAARSAAAFTGFALEPIPLRQCLLELQARGIEHKTPEPFVSALPNGSQGTLWTTVVLPQVTKPSLSVFLYEYNPAFLNAEVRRNKLGGQLVLNKGGPLGVELVKEITIGTSDWEPDLARWQKLLLPMAPSTPGLWRIGNGPAIHLVAHPRDRILKIVLKVRSLPQARAFLAEKKLLGPVSAREIIILPSRIQGLGIALSER